MDAMTTSSSSKTIAIALTSLFALSTLAACTPSKTAVDPKQPTVAKDMKDTDDKKADDKKMDDKKADEKKADEKKADEKKPEPKK